MSKTMAVRYKSLYPLSHSSAKQQLGREMTKFGVVWGTRAMQLIFHILVLN